MKSWREQEDEEQMKCLAEWSRKKKEKQLSEGVTFLDVFVCVSLFLMFLFQLVLLVKGVKF